MKSINQASRVNIIPIVIGALRRIYKDATTWKEKLWIPAITGSAQISTISGRAHIVSKLFGF